MLLVWAHLAPFLFYNLLTKCTFFYGKRFFFREAFFFDFWEDWESWEGIWNRFGSVLGSVFVFLKH